MAKSLRASRIKKNNVALKKRVFGPVEAARNERLSAKLLELAKAPKEEKKMDDAEHESESHLPEESRDWKEQATDNRLPPDSTAAPEKTEKAAATEDIDMDNENAATKKTRSKREVKRLQEARAQRQVKKSHKKPRNQVTFAAKRKPSTRSGSKR